MKKIFIKSKSKKQVIDITDLINSELQKTGFIEGICQLNILHTTAALTTADLDPGTDQDMLDAFEVIIPKIKYRHPHDPSHVGDHIMSSIIGSTESIPVKDSRLTLGTWQRIVLIELSGPREREVTLSFLSEC